MKKFFTQNKIIAGAVGLIAVISIVNTQAIIKLSKIEMSQNSQLARPGFRDVTIDCLTGPDVVVTGVPNGVMLNDSYWCKKGGGQWFPTQIPGVNLNKNLFNNSETLNDIENQVDDESRSEWRVVIYNVDGLGCTITEITGGTSSSGQIVIYSVDTYNVGWDCALYATPTINSGDIVIRDLDGKIKISSSSSVLSLQYKLNLLGLLSKDMVNGKLGIETREALILFQKINKLKETGIQDLETKKLIDAKIQEFKKIYSDSKKTMYIRYY